PQSPTCVHGAPDLPALRLSSCTCRSDHCRCTQRSIWNGCKLPCRHRVFALHKDRNIGSLRPFHLPVACCSEQSEIPVRLSGQTRSGTGKYLPEEEQRPDRSTR